MAIDKSKISKIVKGLYIFFQGCEPKQDDLCVKNLISNDFGVLEYWRDGAKAKDLTSFFQYSNTPIRHYSVIGSFEIF